MQETIGISKSAENISFCFSSNLKTEVDSMDGESTKLLGYNEMLKSSVSHKLITLTLNFKAERI